MKFNSIRGANVPSVLSHAIVYNEQPGRNPLTRPAPADESAVAVHPLPSGEGRISDLGRYIQVMTRVVRLNRALAEPVRALLDRPNHPCATRRRVEACRRSLFSP